MMQIIQIELNALDLSMLKIEKNADNTNSDCSFNFDSLFCVALAILPDQLAINVIGE